MPPTGLKPYGIFAAGDVMTKIKICGIRSLDDVAIINDCMPDYIGYVFAPSKRQISLNTAIALSANVFSGIKKVGVFVNQPIDFLVSAITSGAVDFVQLHGDETAEYEKKLFAALKNSGIEQPEKRCIRAFRIRNKDDIEKTKSTMCATLLLDAYSEKAVGGTGETFDWTLINNIEKPFFLAGGISIDNAEDAVNSAHPFALDVSSSLETNSKKDRAKVEAFVKKIRGL